MEKRQRIDWRFAVRHRVAELPQRRLQAGFIVSMDDHQQIARSGCVANFHLHFYSDCVINLIAFSSAARAQSQRRPCDAISKDGADGTALSRAQTVANLRLRQSLQILNLRHIAALRLHHAMQVIESGASSQRLIDFGTRRRQIRPAFALTGKPQHMRRHFDAVFVKIGRTFTPQSSDRFRHFQSIADGGAERLIRIR